ncbi:hypothetical protein PYCCODRAFT_1466918 [Trametes coccinea BRFM310]|uniref:Protein kinase domain-containing protein n=1 Tax=Trametes coccinea (strain BRFM310) TaxID=1353009 RepID=A0A1Y2IQZ1_TRAC3|nr:hypothetical protein PYCCODRAFT_1466918 [Trametes coccinea BRFM310]
MASPSFQNTHQLDIKFNGSTKYTFSQPSLHSHGAEITIVGEAEKRTFQGAPLILTYDGAHCIYRGAMVQRNIPGGKSSIPLDVAVKWVAGNNRITRLRHEAEVYEKLLGPLQGVAVPRYYGFFIGTVETVTVACMILEWCGGLPSENVHELNRQRMVAATQVHKAGVFHGTLLDTRHFIPARDGTLRIIDFSVARPHRCPGSLPLSLNHADSDSRPDGSCGELDVMESRFGVDAERHGRQLRWANGMYPELVRSFCYQY